MEKKEKKVGIDKAEIKNFFGNLYVNEISLADIPSQSSLLAIYGYRGLAGACIDVIANSVASAEWFLIKENKKKGSKYNPNSIITKERMPTQDEVVNSDDEIYQLLVKPNPIFDWYEHIKFHQIFMELFGESYWYLVKNKLGKVAEIWLIPPFYVKPIKSMNKNAHPYEIDHFLIMTLYGDIKVNPDEIIYFRNPNPYNPLRGMGTIEKAYLERDLNTFSKVYSRNFFKNGGIPAGVLVTDQRLTPEEIEDLKRLWKDTYGGLDNSWKVAFLWGGWRYQEISVDPSSKEFRQLGEWSREDLCMIFGVPQAKLGLVKDVNRANAFILDITYAKETILPRLKQIQSKINYDLLPKIGATNYKFIFKDPTPQNMELNIRKLKEAGKLGILTVNEAREMIGLPPLPDEQGNQIVMPIKEYEGKDDEFDFENLDRIVERLMEEGEFDY